MKSFSELLSTVLCVVPWLMGIALAKGVWMTLGAIIIVPYSWYLVVHYFVEKYF